MMLTSHINNVLEKRSSMSYSQSLNKNSEK